MGLILEVDAEHSTR